MPCYEKTRVIVLFLLLQMYVGVFVCALMPLPGGTMSWSVNVDLVCDLLSLSNITPCNKIDKTLVVYRFSNITLWRPL